MKKNFKLIFGALCTLVALVMVVYSHKGFQEGNDLIEDIGYILFAVGLGFITLGLSKKKV